MKADPLGYIYRITCQVSKKSYIGLTTLTVDERWRLHIIHALNAKKLTGIKAAICKYGAKNFTISQIDTAYSIAELVSKEIQAICSYNTRAPKGYNLTDGGELSSGTPIIVNDIEYPSITKAAEYYGIPFKLVWSRLTKGKWSVSEAFELAPPPILHKQAVEIHGECFVSQSELARAYGISNQLVWARLNSGWSIEEAIGLEPSPVSYELEGVYYESRASAARKHNIEPHLVSSRIANGWTINQAFNLAPPPKSIKIKGSTYEYFSDACKEYDINYETASSRVSRGWTYEQALSITSPPNDYSIVVNGFKYNTVKEACRCLELPEKTVRYRLKSKWTIEQAFEISLPPKIIYSGNEIVIEGVKYPSLSSAVKAYVFSYDTIKQRIQRGWSVEQAFNLVPPPPRKVANSLTIELEGISYPSFASAARHYGLSLTMVKKRMKDGWSKYQAFEIEDKENYKGPQIIEFEGHIFKSFTKAAEHYGINIAVANLRKKKKWNLEKILKTPVISSKQAIVVDDKSYASISEAARCFGIRPKLVHNRIKKGWTLEKSLKTPVN